MHHINPHNPLLEGKLSFYAFNRHYTHFVCLFVVIKWRWGWNQLCIYLSWRVGHRCSASSERTLKPAEQKKIKSSLWQKFKAPENSPLTVKWPSGVQPYLFICCPASLIIKIPIFFYSNWWILTDEICGNMDFDYIVSFHSIINTLFFAVNHG